MAPLHLGRRKDLTAEGYMPILIGNMKAFTTPETARLAGIHLRTLHRWLERGVIPEPKRGNLGGLKVRLWSASDVRRVKEYRKKFWAKGRGRKRKH